MNNINLADGLKTDDIWVVIPVYNNADSIFKVVEDVLSIWPNVIVIDDGSHDISSLKSLLSSLKVIVLEHGVNKGKGVALRTAASFIESKHGRYMITLDGDGQHYPQDIKSFFSALNSSGTSFLIGKRDFNTENIPDSSIFGRRFSNFWVHLETGKFIADTQSGFRVYPVKYFNKLKLKKDSYDFEIEVLVKLIWAGMEVKSIPIDVYYPPVKERVSHFHPIKDNFRLAILHTQLILSKLLPFSRKKYVINKEETGPVKFILHPVKLIKYLLQDNATPSGLAAAAFIGVFIGTLPVFGFHTLAIIYISTRLHLNKVLGIGIQNVCTPPFVPAFCIFIGHYMSTGNFYNKFSAKDIFSVDRLYEWFLGSLILAPVLGIVAFAVILFIARYIKRNMEKT